MNGKRLSSGLLCGLFLSASAVAGITNPGFNAGMTAWTVGGGSVGIYSDAAGPFALFSDVGGQAGPASSYIYQAFVIAGGDHALSFEYVLVTSGTYTGSGALPDAFTARLLDPGTLQPLLNTPGVNDYFYQDTRGADDSVDYDPAIVTLSTTAARPGWLVVIVDLTSLPPGTQAILQFDLMGTGMLDGQMTYAGVDNVALASLNNAPVLAPIGNQTLDEAATLEVVISANDPDGDPVTFVAANLPSFAGFSDNGDGTAILSLAPGYDDAGEYPGVEITVSDGELADNEPITIIVNNVNRPPIVDPIADQTLDEGGTFEAMGSFADPDVDMCSGTVDYGDGSGVQVVMLAPDSTFPLSHTYADNGLYTVTVTIIDNHGGQGTATCTATVNNVPPTVGPITGGLAPIPLKSPCHNLLGWAMCGLRKCCGSGCGMGSNGLMEAAAFFTDPGVLDTHTAQWDWGDGSGLWPGDVAEENGSGSVTGDHAYAAAGIYVVKLQVIDKDGGMGESVLQYVVVYDPNGGFVTGGGWINSPKGAYTPDPALVGRVHLAFDSKYAKGACLPTGQTEFQFRVADLNFHSASYEWLVVQGARAQFKGSGRINHSGDYGFMLTAVDGQLSGGGGVDKVRIKIWDRGTGKIVYDNGTGQGDDAVPTTAITGGSIVIHKGRG